MKKKLLYFIPIILFNCCHCRDTKLNINNDSLLEMAQNNTCPTFQAPNKDCIYYLYVGPKSVISCTSNGRELSYYTKDGVFTMDYIDTIVNNNKALLCLVKQGDKLMDWNLLAKESDSSIIIERVYLQYGSHLRRTCSIRLNEPVDKVFGKDFGAGISYSFFKHVSAWVPPKDDEGDFDYLQWWDLDYKQSGICLNGIKIVETDSIGNYGTQYHAFKYDGRGNLSTHVLKSEFGLTEKKFSENKTVVGYKINGINYFGRYYGFHFFKKNGLYDSSIIYRPASFHHQDNLTDIKIIKRTKGKNNKYASEATNGNIKYKIEITEARANEIMAKNPEKWPTQ